MVGGLELVRDSNLVAGCNQFGRPAVEAMKRIAWDWREYTPKLYFCLWISCVVLANYLRIGCYTILFGRVMRGRLLV